MTDTPEPAREPLKPAQVATLQEQVTLALNAWRLLQTPGTIVSLTVTPEAGQTATLLTTARARDWIMLDVARCYAEAAAALTAEGHEVPEPPETMLRYFDEEDRQ
jgi:hypothetical protein